MNTGAFARLYDLPADADGWKVLADELQSVGDPRGELVALSLNGEHERFRQRLSSYLVTLFDDEERAALGAYVQPTYENGLWSALAIGDGVGPSQTGDVLARLLVSPLAVLLRTLEAQLDTARDARRVVHAMERGALALRELRIAATEPWLSEGCFAPPRLENVSLRNVEIAGELRHQRLKTLRLTLGKTPLLGSMHFPQLEVLELRSYGDFPALEEAWDLPRLKHLTVQTYPGLLAHLAGLPWTRSLRVLELETIGADQAARTADELLHRLDDFPGLRELRWHDGPQAARAHITSALSARGP